MNYDKLQIDSPVRSYEVFKKYIGDLKGVPGLTCEIGLRRGGGTKYILDYFLENNDVRPHICVDPYGNIPYADAGTVIRYDYTNNMKNETLSELFKYAFDNSINILFFNLEDSEFYKRFSDGVPVYDQEKQLINDYCFAHIDGQHDEHSVNVAATFFSLRISIGGIIAFDNTNHYDHTAVHELMISNGFILSDEFFYRKVYKRISK